MGSQSASLMFCVDLPYMVDQVPVQSSPSSKGGANELRPEEAQPPISPELRWPRRLLFPLTNTDAN